MARLEFAILQYLEQEGHVCKKCGIRAEGLRVVLRRNEDEFLERLQIKVKENLGNPEEYEASRVSNAINKAFKSFIKEFKYETIRIV